jgi:hypothetical protein
MLKCKKSIIEIYLEIIFRIKKLFIYKVYMYFKKGLLIIKIIYYFIYL